MYGLQQSMKTKIMTKVIFTVLTLAFGMRPLELARRDSTSSSLAPEVLPRTCKMNCMQFMILYLTS